MEIEAEGTTNKGPYSTDFGEVVQQRKVQSVQQRRCMHFEASWHRNRGTFNAGNSIQQTQNLWHEFLDSPYNIKCCDSHTVVRISCTEIEEQNLGLFRRRFGSSSEISLCKFLL
jgi:hypothetical protein